MSYIITGHKGFIGKNLANRFDGYIGFGIDDNYDENAFKECDGIFHIGACADLREPDINNMFYHNFVRSRVVFEFAKKYDKRVVFASSSAIYGYGGSLVRSSGPTNSYSWSKYCAEKLGMSLLGDKFISLRFFNTYGIGEEHKGLMSSIPYQIYKSDNFGIFPQDGNEHKSPQRDFIWVEDVVDACILAMKEYTTINGNISGIYDVGTGKPTSYNDICDVLDVPYHFTNVNQKPIGYQDYTCAATHTFLPNWTPTDPLIGIKKYKEQLDGR